MLVRGKRGREEEAVERERESANEKRWTRSDEAGDRRKATWHKKEESAMEGRRSRESTKLKMQVKR